MVLTPTPDATARSGRLFSVTNSLIAITVLGAFLPTLQASPVLPQIPSTTEVTRTSAFLDSNWLKFYFNTDDGKIYQQYSNYPWEEVATPAGVLVSQDGGPDIRVWDFASFNAPEGGSLQFIGSLPAAIRSKTSITIAGTVTVSAGGYAGGEGGRYDAEPTGSPGAGDASAGYGGAGLGGLHRDNTGFLDTAHAGGGGGGGMASGGQAGFSGKSVVPHEWNGSAWVPSGAAVEHLGGPGGPAYTQWSILRGGGGGGGGGAGIRHGGGHHGGRGGRGGGAILFVARENFTLASTGAIRADGADAEPYFGGDGDASGGGGAGGFIGFAVTGVWTNRGTITARGGMGQGPAEGDYTRGGAGSGGYIDVDPTKIINEGSIDVAGGISSATEELGGAVVFVAQEVVNTGTVTGSASTVTTRPSRLTNLSVRSIAGTQDSTLIVGMYVAGSGTKQVLLRGAGPSLVKHGVQNVLADPNLALFSEAKAELARNDTWGGTDVLRDLCTRLGAFSFPLDSPEPMILAAVGPGLYTAHVGSAAGTGIVLVEAYDADELDAPARLTNISARSETGNGEGVVIVGFAISGTQPKTVLIRAIGPTLSKHGVANALTDSTLELYRGQAKLDENDDWGGAALLVEAFATTYAFGLDAASKDAALLVALTPGSYTAHLRGKNGEIGVGLVEVYEVP